MSHFLMNDDEYRDLIYDDDYRSYLMARSNPPGGYKFSRLQGKRFRVRARSALGVGASTATSGAWLRRSPMPSCAAWSASSSFAVFA
jgi:hypothetical protein